MKRQLPVIPVNPLPPLYGAWMDQLLRGPIPIETKTTCDAAMAQSAVDPSDPSGNTAYIGSASGGVWKTTNVKSPSK